jgi:hypothetical protein
MSRVQVWLRESATSLERQSLSPRCSRQRCLSRLSTWCPAGWISTPLTAE